MSRYVTPIFLASGFMSNLGSLVFQISFSVYALQTGMSLAAVGTILGASRIAQVLANVFAGHLGDRANARSVLVWTDLAGATTDVLIMIVSILFITPPILVISAILMFRGLALGIQFPLRAKIGKLLSSEGQDSGRKMAISLNVIAQGTTLFGALFALLLKSKTGLIGVCLFDLFTFALSSGAALCLPDALVRGTQASAISSWSRKFRDYCLLDRRLFAVDLLITFPVWGTQSLFMRMTQAHPDYLPYCMLMYGMAVITSGLVVAKLKTFKISPWIWLVQSASFAAAIYLNQNFWLVLIPVALAYLIYFYAWHAISVEYQLAANADTFAALSSARNVTAVLIVSLGEFVVSAGSKYYLIASEFILRTGFCLAIAFIIYYLPKPTSPDATRTPA